MRQVAQNYRSGELAVLDVPRPACSPGGVLVRSLYSLISTGTELMKLGESKMSLIGKARARPDQLKKVLDTVQQQGPLNTYRKAMNQLDSYTPLGYSLAGIVVEVGRGAEEFHVGQLVACAGNEFALHADFNWVPVNLCVPVPDGVAPDQAAFATGGIDRPSRHSPSGKQAWRYGSGHRPWAGGPTGRTASGRLGRESRRGRCGPRSMPSG